MAKEKAAKAQNPEEKKPAGITGGIIGATEAPAEKAPEKSPPAPDELTAAEERLAAQQEAERKAALQAKLGEELLEAARKGNVGELKDLLAKGAPLSANDDGNTALFYAAQYGRMDAVLFLLKEGIELDVKNRIGSTPLMGAAAKGHKEVARLLYDLGSDPYAKNATGSSAVSYARGAGYADVVKDLSQPRQADTVTFTRPVGDLTLQEVFNFAKRDRLTILRRGADGPVEAVQRDSFTDLSDKAALREAFTAYAKRGGKLPESDFFPPPPAPEPETEKPAPRKSWRPWRK